MTDKEKEKYFETRGEADSFWTFMGVIIFVIAGIFWLAPDKNTWSALTIGFWAFCFAIFVLTYNLLVSQSIAVNQCLAVVEKCELGLNFWQTRSLSRSFPAGDVFVYTVGLIKEERSDLIPEGWFGGSGESVEAYRRLVRYLWKEEVVPQVPTGQATETTQEAVGVS